MNMDTQALDDVFPEPTTTDLAPLRTRLAGAADEAALLAIAYRTVDSPYGALLVAATDDGIVRVAFEREGHDAVLDALATTISPRILRSERRTDDVARQLDEYFARRRRTFDVPVDLQLAHGFRHDVLVHLRAIEYGRTETYSDVARAAGRAAAVRAAASACAQNPVPIVVPCHRVVRRDGSFGEYRGGAAVKAALIAMEAA
jgi:methylated-DNA-[protein]-cysteine S-methyltransferase